MDAVTTSFVVTLFRRGRLYDFHMADTASRADRRDWSGISKQGFDFKVTRLGELLSLSDVAIERMREDVEGPRMGYETSFQVDGATYDRVFREIDEDPSE